MLGTILKDPVDSVKFKSTCERPEIQDLNDFNSILKNEIDRAGSRPVNRSFFSRSLSDPIKIA